MRARLRRRSWMRLSRRAEHPGWKGKGRMESRLGAQMVRAQNRLRTLRQGPDRVGAAVEPDIEAARLGTAAWISLRAVSDRSRPQNLEIRRAGCDGRSVDAVRADRGAQVFSVAQSEARAAAVPR